MSERRPRKIIKTTVSIGDGHEYWSKSYQRHNHFALNKLNNTQNTKTVPPLMLANMKGNECSRLSVAIIQVYILTKKQTELHQRLTTKLHDLCYINELQFLKPKLNLLIACQHIINESLRKIRHTIEMMEPPRASIEMAHLANMELSVYPVVFRSQLVKLMRNARKQCEKLQRVLYEDQMGDRRCKISIVEEMVDSLYGFCKMEIETIRMEAKLIALDTTVYRFDGITEFMVNNRPIMIDNYLPVATIHKRISIVYKMDHIDMDLIMFCQRFLEMTKRGVGEHWKNHKPCDSDDEGHSGGTSNKKSINSGAAGNGDGDGGNAQSGGNMDSNGGNQMNSNNERDNNGGDDGDKRGEKLNEDKNVVDDENDLEDEEDDDEETLEAMETADIMETMDQEFPGISTVDIRVEPSTVLEELEFDGIMHMPLAMPKSYDTVTLFPMDFDDEYFDYPSAEYDQSLIFGSEISAPAKIPQYSDFGLDLNMDGTSLSGQSSYKTKKFYESDNTNLSEIFSQTIQSAGVTPTDDDSTFLNDFSQVDISGNGAGKDLSEYGAVGGCVVEKPEMSVDWDFAVKGVDDGGGANMNQYDEENLSRNLMKKLNLLEQQQQPSIVIDCYDDSLERCEPYYQEPITPVTVTPPSMLSQSPITSATTTTAAYFDLTINDDLNIDNDNYEYGDGDDDDDEDDGGGRGRGHIMNVINETSYNVNDTIIDADIGMHLPNHTNNPQYDVFTKRTVTDTEVGATASTATAAAGTGATGAIAKIKTNSSISTSAVDNKRLDNKIKNYSIDDYIINDDDHDGEDDQDAVVKSRNNIDDDNCDVSTDEYCSYNEDDSSEGVDHKHCVSVHSAVEKLENEMTGNSSVTASAVQQQQQQQQQTTTVTTTTKTIQQSSTSTSSSSSTTSLSAIGSMKKSAIIGTAAGLPAGGKQLMNETGTVAGLATTKTTKSTKTKQIIGGGAGDIVSVTDPSVGVPNGVGKKVSTKKLATASLATVETTIENTSDVTGTVETAQIDESKKLLDDMAAEKALRKQKKLEKLEKMSRKKAANSVVDGGAVTTTTIGGGGGVGGGGATTTTTTTGKKSKKKMKKSVDHEKENISMINRDHVQGPNNVGSPTAGYRIKFFNCTNGKCDDRPIERHHMNTILEMCRSYEDLIAYKESTNELDLISRTKSIGDLRKVTSTSDGVIGANLLITGIKKNFFRRTPGDKEGVNVDAENLTPKIKSFRLLDIRTGISVKDLCRSYEDLIVLRERPIVTFDCHDGVGTKRDLFTRTKSIGDLRRYDEKNNFLKIRQHLRSVFTDFTMEIHENPQINNGKYKENMDNRKIYTGVSVKKLKSSFSKFDALQKNVLHVRSSDPDKAQEKFNGTPEIEKNCHACGKVVFQMEQIKAEKNLWHKNCFRCSDCSKQLNVDTYQSHESILYCKPHFKALFTPKAVEDNEPVQVKKHELIIRESQPIELSPDVARSSDKPDLGLDELHQLNVKERFQVFEHGDQQQPMEQLLDRSPGGVKRSQSILSKLARFQAKGMDIGVTDDSLDGVEIEQTTSEEEDEENGLNEDADIDLIRAKRAQKERPIRGENMDDIKTRFESGHIMTKEERREERKQEIQNIRSRLFLGKQAKIKEMYQQAVADSEVGITASSKKPDVDIGDKAKSIKERFERGEAFNTIDEDEAISQAQNKANDGDVFEQAISKKSRSLFMELDASASKTNVNSQNNANTPTTPRTPDVRKHIQPFANEEVVKCDEKMEDVKIETAEISSKFKFFERYQPNEKEKKKFRITPPREGVVKMSSPERDVYRDPDVVRGDENMTDDPAVAEEMQTASKMLSIFRQMEQKKYDSFDGPKPLKRFTPPPDEGRRRYDSNSENNSEFGDSEDDEEDDDDEEEEDDEEENDQENNRDYVRSSDKYEDEFLKQAQNAARAKQLRAKFEKWESKEIKREQNNSSINLYESNDDSQVESAKSLRAKFESMRNTQSQQDNHERVKVNRFVKEEHNQEQEPVHVKDVEHLE